MGKIIHGNKNFGYAPISIASGGVASFGTPVMLSGMVSCEMEIDQDSSTIYADDKAYFKALGAKARSATCAFRQIPAEYAEYLGFHKNTNGSVSDTGEHRNHCIFFETTEEDNETGKVTQTLHYLYNVKGGEPSFSTATDEDDVTAEEIEVEYECSDSTFVVDDAGAFVQYAYITRTETNATKYDTFKTNVLLPTTSMN